MESWKILFVFLCFFPFLLFTISFSLNFIYVDNYIFSYRILWYYEKKISKINNNNNNNKDFFKITRNQVKIEKILERKLIFFNLVKVWDITWKLVMFCNIFCVYLDSFKFFAAFNLMLLICEITNKILFK